MGVSEIILALNDVDQLLIAPGSLFYGKRMLRPDAEEFIIEEATMASSNDHIHLKVHLNNEGMHRKDEISTAIHQHFIYRRKKSELQLRKVLQLGWQSLLTSIIFFGLLVFLT